MDKVSNTFILDSMLIRATDDQSYYFPIYPLTQKKKDGSTYSQTSQDNKL